MLDDKKKKGGEISVVEDGTTADKSQLEEQSTNVSSIK